MSDLPRVETFPNPNPGRDYVIEHVANEFTSVCPKTGHPDFGIVIVRYVAKERCVELKSLKLYLQSYRSRGIFYEAVTNEILDHLVEACAPRWMEIETRWTGRGGIQSIIRARHDAK
jgi:7-cyano-7-deazaguanine reductase